AMRTSDVRHILGFTRASSRIACAIAIVIVVPFTASAATDAGQKDVFGVVKKYPTALGGKTWTSQHWANGHARYITGRDPDDPTAISENRSDQAQLWVDGKGILQFIGSGASAEPRLHLNGGSAYFFKNVEITFYYWKTSD